MNLRHLAFIAVLLAVTLTVAPFADASATEITTVHDACWKANDMHDAAAMGRLLTDDFFFVSRTGAVIDRKAYLDLVGKAAMLSGGKREISRINDYGDTAVLIDLGTYQSSAGEQVKVLCTSTFVRVGGIWKWASFQATPVL